MELNPDFLTPSPVPLAITSLLLPKILAGIQEPQKPNLDPLLLSHFK